MNSIVEAILQNLMELMPWRIVMSYQMGVRWTFGRNPKPLNPGFRWRIWAVHHIEEVVVCETVMNLPTQTVVTKDGKTVSFSANIGYTILDPVKHLCNVTDFKAATEGLAMIHLARRVRERTFGECQEEMAKLERSLRDTLSTRFKDWGTEVTSVGFTDFLLARPIRLLQDWRG